ncbi:MAG TPA: hypothetical protein VFY89_08370, partial [Ktedonobacterales bacterium]
PQGIRHSFAPHLANTTPGIIQRISDAFSSDPGTQMVREVNEALDETARAGGETRLGAIVQLSMQQLREPERLFIIALGLFDGDTVGGQVLRAVADRLRQVDDPTPEELVENAIARRYLRPVETTKNLPITRQRYYITKLGRGVSRTLILREGPQSELRAGAAVLDYYRSAPGRRRLEYAETLPNVLGIMEWAQVPPRALPQGDVITFSRLFRDVVYYAGSWGPGSLWLRYAMNIARQTDRQSVLGELAGAHARIQLGRGRPMPALDEIAVARKAFALAHEDAESDLELGVGDTALLKSNMLYCRLQTLWLDHLTASSQLARVSGFTSDETLRGIIAAVTATRDQLREETASGPARHAWLTRRIALALTLDEAETRIRLGESLYRGDHHGEARQQWARVRDLARDVRERAATTLKEHGTRTRTSRATAPRAKAAGNRAALDAMMVSWRTEGMLYRYQSEHAPIWRRPLLRRRGVLCLERSLRYAAQLSSRYEQALGLYEVAQLAMTGVPAVRHTPRPPRALWVVRVARAGLCWGSPRWWRLRTAKAQVRLASAYSSALGAQVIHVRCLVALADIALRQWRMNPRDDLFQAAREYAQHAQAIVGRLREATPELAERLYLLPAWILTPAEASHEKAPPSIPISA